jgi:hypothetical protein
MSFLAPWFVAAGLAAISLPIVFHLFRRTPRGRVRFSSLLFLSPSPPRLTSRSRLENWPLLLMRATVFALLAFAFGRPFLRQLLEQRHSNAAGTQTVVLIDTSASMRRGDLWPRAVAAAQQIADRAEPADEIAVVAYGTNSRSLVSPAMWREAPLAERAALVNAVLAETAPTWSGTRLDQALLSALEMFDAAERDRKSTEAERARRIVLIGDLQRGASLAGLQSVEWPKNVPVEVVVLTATGSNAGISPLAGDDAAPTAPDANRPRLLITNAADSKRESFELAWKESVVSGQLSVERTTQGTPSTVNGQRTTDNIENHEPRTTNSVSIYIPPGQTRVVRAPLLPPGDAAELVLRGDDESFDNRLWFVPPTRETVRVLNLTSEKGDDPQTSGYFLDRAFASPVGGRTVTVESIDPHDLKTRPPTARDLEQVPLVMLGGEQAVPAAWTDALGPWLERGGVAVAVVTTKNGAWRSLLPAALAAADHVSVADSAATKDYALLGEIDFRHPLFAPLADPRFSDFTKIRFHKYRKLTLDDAAAKLVRVAAQFDSGDPAIVDVPRGAGRLFLFAAGWQPRESQLGVSSKFVPLVQTMLELGWHRAPAAASYETGATVELAQLAPANAPSIAADENPQQDAQDAERAPWTITTPDGKQRALPRDTTTFTFDAGPGLYKARSGNRVQRFAVHLPADESKTAPWGLEALESVGVRLARDETAAPTEAVAETRSLQSRELESRQQLWRWCVVLALGVTIVETWYAGRTARREELA